MPQNISECSTKINLPELTLEQLDVLKFLSSDNVGISIPLEVFLKTALQKHKHLIDIILNRRTTLLPSYNHFRRDVNLNMCECEDGTY